MELTNLKNTSKVKISLHEMNSREVQRTGQQTKRYSKKVFKLKHKERKTTEK